MSKKEKIKNITLAILCFIAGIIGCLLPIMPGFVFFALGLWFLSHTSAELHDRFMKWRLYRYCEEKFDHNNKKMGTE